MQSAPFSLNAVSCFHISNWKPQISCYCVQRCSYCGMSAKWAFSSGSDCLQQTGLLN